MRQRSGRMRGLALCVLAALALCAPAWAENENYTQDYLYEDDGGSWRNVQIATDRNGQTYFLLYDSEGKMSYIHKIPKDFSGKREDLTTHYMTIEGRADIRITNDEAASYVYYTLAGDETRLYRLPLKRGYSGQPEVRDFTLEDSPLVFTNFALAKDPDQILLVSKETKQRKVTIGLFSFSSWNASGDNEPIRTWTCTLPEGRTYTPPPLTTTEDVGYRVDYEASTERVWLSVLQTYRVNNDQTSYYKWFFHAPIDQGGTLQAFYPEKDVPGWDDTLKFKEFSIDRYRRIVRFTEGENPNRTFTGIAVYGFNTGGEMQLSSRVDTWTDSMETERPLKEFWSGKLATFTRQGSMVDSQGRLYAYYRVSDGLGNESFVRIARFAPEQKIVADVMPNPAADGKTQPANKIVLEANPFKGPEGYMATGSRWEVYKKTAKIQSASDVLSIRSDEDQEPVYVGRNTDGSPSHTLKQTLPAGDYVWSMIYYYWQSGGEKGTTDWSALGSFKVATSTDSTPDSGFADGFGEDAPRPGGGGCDAGVGGLALLIAAALALRKKA